MGFVNHKQEVFNLVQALKMLFLYTQSKKNTVEEYAQDFRSLWGLLGVHKELTDRILKTVMTTGGVAMAAQVKAAGEESSEAVKATLLISGANRCHYRMLKDALASNYLLVSDQYPNMFEKALCILGNYQTTKTSVPYKASSNDMGVVFLQRCGWGGRGRGRQGSCGEKGEERVEAGSSDDISMMTGKTGEEGLKTNSKGKSHCFNCGPTSHWAYECPQLSGEQQVQLHMDLEGQEKGEQEAAKEEHQMHHVSLTQGRDLPDNQAYLDACLAVTALKNDKFLPKIRAVQGGIRINCNAQAVVTNKKGKFGRLKLWYLPDRTANIFLMHELEKMYWIMYDSWEGFYIVHMPRGAVCFHKDKQGLPYIDLAESCHKVARMLLQMGKETMTDAKVVETGTTFVQTMRGNYEGYTIQEIVQTKEAQRGKSVTCAILDLTYRFLIFTPSRYTGPSLLGVP